jgi:hypothetical protein
MAAYVSPGPTNNVRAVEPNQFRDAQAGLDGDHQQSMVAPAFPAGAVRGCDQGVNLRWDEERHKGSVETLLGDSQHSLDERRLLWVP